MISISKFIFNIITLIKIYNFNKNIFKKKKIYSNKKILCEFSGNKSNQVSFSYLVNFFRNKYGCSCIGYIDAIDLNYFLKIFINIFLEFKICIGLHLLSDFLVDSRFSFFLFLQRQGRIISFER